MFKKINKSENLYFALLGDCSEEHEQNKEFDEEVIYTIVGSTESDPLENKVSDESPIGKALLGKKVGDIVDVETPGGILTLEIREISK